MKKKIFIVMGVILSHSAAFVAGHFIPNSKDCLNNEIINNARIKCFDLDKNCEQILSYCIYQQLFNSKDGPTELYSIISDLSSYIFSLNEALLIDCRMRNDDGTLLMIESDDKSTKRPLLGFPKSLKILEDK